MLLKAGFAAVFHALGDWSYPITVSDPPTCNRQNILPDINSGFSLLGIVINSVFRYHHQLHSQATERIVCRTDQEQCARAVWEHSRLPTLSQHCPRVPVTASAFLWVRTAGTVQALEIHLQRAGKHLLRSYSRWYSAATHSLGCSFTKKLKGGIL